MEIPVGTFLLFALGASVSFVDAGPAVRGPLNRVQLLGWTAGTVYSDYLVTLVQQRGIDFKPSEEYLQTLRGAGADDELVQAVRLARSAKSGSEEPESASELALLQRVAHGAEMSHGGRYAEAEHEYRSALQLAPQNAAVKLALSFALLSQNEVEEAITELREAVRLDPDEAELHQKLAAVLAKGNGDTAGAIAEQREAVRLEPNSSQRHYNLGAVLQDIGKRDAAIVEYREALRLQPDLVDAHYNVANMLESTNDFDGAIREYREEIRLHPNHAGAHYGLARTVGEKGDIKDAINESREAVRLRPDNTGMRLFLVFALALNRQPFASAHELLQVPSARVILGALLMSLGAIVTRYFKRRRRYALVQKEEGVTMGWTFWLGWVFLTALGFGVGSSVANAIARPMPERLHHVIGWSVAGACVGALQWVALRRRLTGAGWWVLATAAGWLLGTLLFVPGGAMLYGLKFAVTRVREDPMSGIYNGAVVGASIGLVQWFALRRHLNTAGWWILVSALGWAVVYISPEAGPADAGWATVLGLITGSLTGLLMLWLSGRPKIPSPSHP